MRDKPYLETKTALTPAERLKAAYAVLINGWDQHEVASLMGVNPGRVNEAVTAIRKAIDPEAFKHDKTQARLAKRKFGLPGSVLGEGHEQRSEGAVEAQLGVEG